MIKVVNKFSHKIRNLIPLTKSEINSLTINNTTPEQLICLIQAYNESLIMCNDIINDNYNDINKK
jgi:hypothetical protein